MDNRGKAWTSEHDQQLLDAPHLSNQYLGQVMGRTENAIKFRRSHLAVKMHQQCPETPLEECVGLMGGDMQQAETLLEQWRAKQATFSTFLTKRKNPEGDDAYNPLHPPPPPKPVPSLPVPPVPFAQRSVGEQIALVCKSLSEEEGRLWNLWNDPAFVPVLIQHYRGFEAYARFIQQRQP